MVACTGFVRESLERILLSEINYILIDLMDATEYHDTGNHRAEFAPGVDRWITDLIDRQRSCCYSRAIVTPATVSSDFRASWR